MRPNRRHAKNAAALLLVLAALFGTPNARAEAPPVQVEWAQRYEHGEGVILDTARAMALYCAAADAGSVDARYHIGWMYLLGRGVERNSATAARWLAGAAASGHSQAAAVMVRFRLASDGAISRCAPAEAAAKPKISVAAVAPAEVARLIADLAPQHGLDPNLVLAVIQVESAFHADAISPKNARGLMQVIPATAQRFGIDEPMEVRGNLLAGMRYLRWLLSYFRGDVTLSLAAYNAGEKRVVEYRGIPPYPETQAYVRRVQSYYPAKHHPFDPQVSAQSGRPWPELAEADLP